MTEKVRAQLVNIEFNHGLNGDNNNQRSAIFRPFDRIIKQGKPTGYLKFLFLNIEKTDLGINELDKRIEFPSDMLRVFGIICFTKGGKFLFYPGFTSTHLLKYRDIDKPLRYVPCIDIDHFSLERSLNRWHITHSTGKIEKHAIKLFDKGVIHWFGISIRSTVKFEPVFRNNLFGYLCPVSDAERRLNDIVQSLKYRDEIIVTPGNSNCLVEPYFWHFEFYIKIDPKTYDQPVGLMHIPIKSPDLFIPEDSQIPWFSYETNIPNSSTKFVIVSTTIPGVLPDDVVISY